MERNEKGEFLRKYKGGQMDGWARGMTNMRASHDIPIDMLRNAVNVDILASGKLRRRPGIVQVVADAGAHSLYSNGSHLVWATDNTLKYSDTNFAKATVLTNALLANPLSYAAVNGVTYFSNSDINGKIITTGIYAGTYEPWGIVPPISTPAATSNDAGPRDRVYQITCTFVIKRFGLDIEESGAPLATSFAGGHAGITMLTAIPQSTDARVTHTRIYLSDVNGDMLYQVTDVAAGTTTASVSRSTQGKKLSSQFLKNPPLGQLIESCLGRMWIAADNVLYFTEPMRYGAYHSMHGFFMFPERITLLKAVDDGLYVSSDATYFLPGVPKNAELKPILPYKAIEGAHCTLSATHDVMWLSERGIVLGRNGGEVINLTESRIAMDSTTRACMGVVELDGDKRVIAMMRDGTDSRHVAEDYIEDETERLADL